MIGCVMPFRQRDAGGLSRPLLSIWLQQGRRSAKLGLDLPLALSILEATEQIKSQLRDPVRDLSASVPDGILCRTSLACYKTLGYRSSDCRNFPQTSKYLFPPITYVSLWWAPRMT